MKTHSKNCKDEFKLGDLIRINMFTGHACVNVVKLHENGYNFIDTVIITNFDVLVFIKRDSSSQSSKVFFALCLLTGKIVILSEFTHEIMRISDDNHNY